MPRLQVIAWRAPRQRGVAFFHQAVQHLAAVAGATGIVFGDIGTSPLYAFQGSLIGPHKLPIDPFHVLGVLSLLV